MYEIRQATREDAEIIARNLRKEDAAEIWASHRTWPIELPGRCDYATTFCATHDGVPFVIFGCNREDGCGVPWLLATDSVHTHSVYFLRTSAKICRQWLKEYKLLTNLMMKTNALCRAWLEWLRLEFMEEVTLNGVPFVRFEKRCE